MHSHQKGFLGCFHLAPSTESGKEHIKDIGKILLLKLCFPCGGQCEGKEMSPDPPWRQCLHYTYFGI